MTFGSKTHLAIPKASSPQDGTDDVCPPPGHEDEVTPSVSVDPRPRVHYGLGNFSKVLLRSPPVTCSQALPHDPRQLGTAFFAHFCYRAPWYLSLISKVLEGRGLCCMSYYFS